MVVMPTRNQAAFIERAIASVVAQLGEADTFVVVDGGSNDGTHEVLQKWQSRITKVMIEPGTSQAEALPLHHQPPHGACLAIPTAPRKRVGSRTG